MREHFGGNTLWQGVKMMLTGEEEGEVKQNERGSVRTHSLTGAKDARKTEQDSELR